METKMYKNRFMDLTEDEAKIAEDFICANLINSESYKKYNEDQKNTIRKLVFRSGMYFPECETALLKHGWDYEKSFEYVYNMWYMIDELQIFETGDDGFYIKNKFKNDWSSLKDCFFEKNEDPKIRFLGVDKKTIQKEFLTYKEFIGLYFKFYDVFGKENINDVKPKLFEGLYFDHIVKFLCENEDVHHISFTFENPFDYGYFSREFCNFTNHI